MNHNSRRRRGRRSRKKSKGPAGERVIDDCLIDSVAVIEPAGNVASRDVS